ncbi:hypothetical protein GCM10009828_050150 [Actinoplanes couchii]|uniref:Major facilitator superfamily (MFS) profile domain-containing protein n=1 Tax=Actinoplanes couchii TaxID=403638 RepID=A0ABQ3X817_9ACTN|nr:hypothetical protein Aco03nite_030450 [Actinoplanes couchii]
MFGALLQPATLAVRVPVPARSEPARFDLLAAALLAAALAIGVHTLSGIPAHGWTTTPTVLGLAAALGVAWLFVVRERRATAPLVPPPVARSVPVMASSALLLVASGALFGALFAVTFFAQDTLGFDPLAGGLRVLPLTVSMILGAPIANFTLRRYGPRRTAFAGTLLVASGVALLSTLAWSSSWLSTSVAFGVLGAGFATVSVTATGTVVTDAPPGHAGVVGGLKQTAMNIGPTLGIATAAATMPLTGYPATLLILAVIATTGLLPVSLLPRARPGLR